MFLMLFHAKFFFSPASFYGTMLLLLGLGPLGPLPNTDTYS